MGSKVMLSLDERTVRGKKVRRLRQEGIVPAVVYGAGMNPVSTQAGAGMLEKAVRDAGMHTPIHLTIGSKRKIAMVKSIDRDPVRRTVRHVAFHAVKQNEPVVAEVPIRLTGLGETEAEKAGLIVLQALDKIEVKALPMDLPEALEVSAEALAEAGDHVTVDDLQLPDSVELVDHSANDSEEAAVALTIASVYEPSALAAANEAAGGDDVDVEDIPADNGGDTAQDTQAAESKPGGKLQDEPKQSELDANKV